MIPCKNCQQHNTVKNGFVRNKQRYKCHACHYTFVLGDERHKQETEVKKALSVILYSLGKASFGFLAKLFGVSRTTTYYWIRDIAATTEAPTIADNIREIDVDEMWHFIQSKKTRVAKSAGVKPPEAARDMMQDPGENVAAASAAAGGSRV